MIECVHNYTSTYERKRVGQKHLYEIVPKSVKTSQGGRLKPATRIPLQPNHTETPTHIEPRTIRPMRQFSRILMTETC